MRADELAASPQERADRGAWYTPRSVAELITGRAFGSTIPRLVVDPTCGGGAFLLAALDAFVDVGLSPNEAVERVAGLDIDPRAIATADRAVRLWASGQGLDACVPRLAVGDALGSWPSDWGTPDLVIGNPPFASPLRATKARSSHDLPAEAVAFRDAHRDELGPYADLAAIHLLNAALRVDPERGRLAMVLPHSLLAGRDVADLQAWLARELPIEDLWISEQRHFDANVRVFAPILARADGAAPPASTAPWAHVAASVFGVPDPDLGDGAPTLGLIGTATAGFRDEYYGMAAACVEGGEGDARPRLVTVGSVEPLELLWGRTPTRFAKQKWERPVVDAALIPAGVKGWFERQLRPKVLLPTQARILEPLVDRDGSMVPVTPLLSIGAKPDDLDRIAAVLLAPPVVAWAARRCFGSALSMSAIKLRAADVLEIPLPEDRGLWAEAAALISQGPDAVDRVAALMHEAYRSTPDVLDWWMQRRR